MNRKELAKAFSENIEQERARLGMSQQEMAKALDISLSTYKNILNGVTDRIDIYSAYLIKKVTGKSYFDLVVKDFPEYRMLRVYNQLTPSQQAYITKIAEFELAFKMAQGTSAQYVPLIIPTADMQDGMLWDSCNHDHFNVADYKIRYGDKIDCAIKVTSDHLSPIYLKGDVLLINQVAPRDGDIGIFISKETGRAYLRKLIRNKDGAEIVPINGTGNTFKVSKDDIKSYDEWIKFGIVISKAR